MLWPQQKSRKIKIQEDSSSLFLNLVSRQTWGVAGGGGGKRQTVSETETIRVAHFSLTWHCLDVLSYLGNYSPKRSGECQIGDCRKLFKGKNDLNGTKSPIQHLPVFQDFQCIDSHYPLNWMQATSSNTRFSEALFSTWEHKVENSPWTIKVIQLGRVRSCPQWFQDVSQTHYPLAMNFFVFANAIKSETHTPHQVPQIQIVILGKLPHLKG